MSEFSLLSREISLQEKFRKQSVASYISHEVKLHARFRHLRLFGLRQHKVCASRLSGEPGHGVAAVQHLRDPELTTGHGHAGFRDGAADQAAGDASYLAIRGFSPTRGSRGEVVPGCAGRYTNDAHTSMPTQSFLSVILAQPRQHKPLRRLNTLTAGEITSDQRCCAVDRDLKKRANEYMNRELY